MRKSAVSVRSGAGMPAHMAGERSAGGGDVREEGTVTSTCDYITSGKTHHRCPFREVHSEFKFSELTKHEYFKRGLIHVSILCTTISGKLLTFTKSNCGTMQ